MTTGETLFGNFPKCPYCGCENEDAWELNLGDGEDGDVNCENCDKEYRINRHISVTYSSRPKLPEATR